MLQAPSHEGFIDKGNVKLYLLFHSVFQFLFFILFQFQRFKKQLKAQDWGPADGEQRALWSDSVAVRSVR